MSEETEVLKIVTGRRARAPQAAERIVDLFREDVCVELDVRGRAGPGSSVHPRGDTGRVTGTAEARDLPSVYGHEFDASALDRILAVLDGAPRSQQDAAAAHGGSMRAPRPPRVAMGITSCGLSRHGGQELSTRVAECPTDMMHVAHGLAREDALS